MSKEERLDGAQPQKIDIFYELPPSPQGAHQYERAGAVVHGDASGEWTLDEDGEVEDIVFFASPRLMGYGHKEKAGVSSDEPQSADTEEGQEPLQEPRVLGHVTWRTREARPDDPMFGRVFIASVPDPPSRPTGTPNAPQESVTKSDLHTHGAED